MRQSGDDYYDGQHEGRKAVIKALRDILYSQRFYNLMQTYRQAPLTPQVVVTDAFDAVKTALLTEVEK